MKQPFYKSPQVHKWGLFACLLGTLGFNLSMNPEHSLLARNTTVYYSMDLAQEAAPVDVRGKKMSVIVAGKSDSYKVDVVEVEGITVAKFSPVTEGKACDLCSVSKPLSASFSNQADVLSEISRIAQGGDIAHPSPVRETAKPAKPGQLLEIDVEVYAAKCEEKEGTEALECHSKSLVQISKALKNHKDQQSIVTDYFKSNIEAALRSSLMSNRSGGYFSTGQEKYEAGQAVVEELSGGLKSINGEKVIALVTIMTAKAITKQAELSKQKILADAQVIMNDPANAQQAYQSLMANRNLLATLGNESVDFQNMFQAIDLTEGGTKVLETAYAPINTLFQTLQAKYFRYDPRFVEGLSQVQIQTGGVNSPTVPSPGTGTTPDGIYGARQNTRSFDSSTLLPTSISGSQMQMQNGTGTGPLMNNNGQQITCPAGYIATGNTLSPCQMPNQSSTVVPGGYQQQPNQSGIPAPRSAIQQRAARIN